MKDHEETCVFKLYEDISETLEEYLMLARKKAPEAERPFESGGDLKLTLNCLKVQHDWNVRHEQNVRELAGIVSRNLHGSVNVTYVNHSIRHLQALIDGFDGMKICDIKDALAELMDLLQH